MYENGELKTKFISLGIQVKNWWSHLYTKQ
jgi:hypothetical protein